MNKFLLTLTAGAVLAALPGIAIAQPFARSCANRNTKGCRDAREAFAKHHGGMYPNQYYNGWYGGREGRWYQRNNAWRWEGMDGDDYYEGPHHHWRWFHHHDED
jgi:hypothetical protein